VTISTVATNSYQKITLKYLTKALCRPSMTIVGTRLSTDGRHCSKTLRSSVSATAQKQTHTYIITIRYGCCATALYYYTALHSCQDIFQ